MNDAASMNIPMIPIDPKRINVAANENATHPVAGAERLSPENRMWLMDRIRPKGRRGPQWNGARFDVR